MGFTRVLMSGFLNSMRYNAGAFLAPDLQFRRADFSHGNDVDCIRVYYRRLSGS